LFTYNPFADLDSYPCPGPIFVHEPPCFTFQGDGVFPEELSELPLTFEGYGQARWLVARERPTAGNLDEAIERLFANPGIEYIHIRNTEAGCFIARIEKLNGASGPGGIVRRSR
jgi:uncharacterized protein DUF1203